MGASTSDVFYVYTSGFFCYSVDMPYRSIPLATGEYYHVYNRGVAQQPVYLLKKDYQRFLLSLEFYLHKDYPFKLSNLLQLSDDVRGSVLSELVKKNNKFVEITAFCLMPNHFHLLLQQKTEGGISKFMKLITDSYTRYFNTRHDRVGPLFQGQFKAVHVSKNEQLVHLSRYIHLNPLVSFVVRDEKFLNYPWSSLGFYSKKEQGMVEPDIVLGQFRSARQYLKFVLDQKDYGRKLEQIKHLVLE